MTDRRGGGHPFLDTSPTPTIVAMPPPVEAPATGGEVRDAHWLLGGQDIDSQGFQAEIDAYSPIVNALTERNAKDPKAPRDLFGNTRDYFGAYRSNHPLAYQRIWEDVNRIRKTDPGFLPDIPANNMVEFADWVKKREQAKRNWGQDIVSRQRGAGQAVIGFGTDMASGFRDPINLGAMALSGGAAAPVDGAITSIWTAMGRAALREGIVNSATAVAQLPELSASRARFGEQMTVGDAAENVATAFGTGAIFGTVHTGGGAALKQTARAVADSSLARAASEIATPLAARFAKPDPIAPADIVREFSAAVDPAVRTPEQNAALHVVQRQADVDASNPYEPTPAGMDAHADALDRVMADIVAAGDPNAAPAKVAPRRTPQTVAAARERPASIVADPNAREQFMSRVRQRESGGSDTARPIDPTTGRPLSSAVGRYQFVEDTWLHYYKQRYGDDGLTRPQILAKRSDGAIQDALMQDMTADNARHLHRIGVPETAGNLYVEHFLGQGGAERVFRADPDTPIETLLTAKAIKANKFLRGKTAREVIEWAHARMGDTTHGDRPILRPETFGDDTEALAESQRAIDAADAEAAAMARRGSDGSHPLDIAGEPTAPVRHEQGGSVDGLAAAARNDVGGLPVAAQAMPVEFTTSRGSVYRVEDSGATTRDKAARADVGHEGQQGPQPTSEETHYVTKEDALKLAEFQAQGGPKVALEKLPDGRVGLKYLSGKDKGKFEKRTVVTPQPAPAIGLTPVETWKGGTRVHFGNEITDVRMREPDGPVTAGQVVGRAVAPSGAEPKPFNLADHYPDPEARADSRSAPPETHEKLFDKPNAPEAERQTMSLDHDARIILDQQPDATFRIGDDEAPRTLADIIAEQDADEAAIQAARACL